MKLSLTIKVTWSVLCLWLAVMPAQGATRVFDAPKPSAKADMTAALRSTIERAVEWQYKHPADTAEVRLRPGAVYNISRQKADALPYNVSNTTSRQENPNGPDKHVGLWLNRAKNIVINGQGATLLTHGEMTPWVISYSENITLTGFTIEAADPSVPEMTVTEVTDDGFVAEVNPNSTYEIIDGKLWWTGEGWRFTGGIAQFFSPADSITMRCESPVVEAQRVEEVAPGKLRFIYGKQPKTEPGISYQMRHSFRTEVAGLINMSRNVTLSGLNLNFMGNFGIVAQVSENITYHNLRCAPDTPKTGRHNSGFADFLQVSGCKGLVKIDGCYFAGAHDDPINVHGTHLCVERWISPDRVVVRYMHPQTFGFQSFFEGDSLSIVNSRTLLPVAENTVASAKMISDYEIEIELSKPAAQSIIDAKDLIIENITWCPEVEITGNTFTLTPTRAILVSTRGKVVINDNLFLRIPMASVLIADDGRSWYESGPVHNATISGNRFVDCSAPQILIAPENHTEAGTVHRNITISDNSFEHTGKTTPFGQSRVEIRARSVDGLKVSGNSFNMQDGGRLERLLNLTDCENIAVDRF